MEFLGVVGQGKVGWKNDVAQTGTNPPGIDKNRSVGSTLSPLPSVIPPLK